MEGKFELGPIGNKDMEVKSESGVSKVWLSMGEYGELKGVKLNVTFPDGVDQCLGVINGKGLSLVSLAKNPLYTKCIKLDVNNLLKITKVKE